MRKPSDEELPAPGEDVFSDADLEPSDEDRKLRRNAILDRAVATLAVIALGGWAGGMIALGACAAPFVFRLTPYPFSGQAMGAAFGRFDSIAVGCGVVALACEIVRTCLGRRGPQLVPRIRRYLAILIAAAAVFSASQLTPEIMRAHNEGVRRGVGPDGERLETVHKRAELIGKVNIAGSAVVIALHMFTLGGLRPRDEELFAEAPLPPGSA